MATEQAIWKVDMDRIEGSYKILDPDAVRELLAHHPHVVPALLEAPARLKEAFGSRLRGLVLELVPDQNEGEDLLSLVGLVRATPAQAFKLRATADEWWSTQSLQVRLMVAFGVAPG